MTAQLTRQQMTDQLIASLQVDRATKGNPFGVAIIDEMIEDLRAGRLEKVLDQLAPTTEDDGS